LQADAKRTAHLEQLGYRILRIHNIDVYENVELVLDALLAQLSATP
jgi:very-short-patch-repair endonuclease